MGAVKRFLEQVSVDIGHGGEITGAAIREGQRRLQQLQKKEQKKKDKEIIKALHHGKLQCKDHEGEVLTPATYAGLFDGDTLCKEAYKTREEFLDSIR